MLSLVFIANIPFQSPNDKDTKKRIKQKQSNEEEYELSRYKPLLRTIIEVSQGHTRSFLLCSTCFKHKESVANRLDESLFPYVKDSPLKNVVPQAVRSTPATTSLRSAKPTWQHKAPKTGPTVRDDKQRLIVFVAGGMTYSEIREAYQLSTSLNKDIFIGIYLLFFFFVSISPTHLSSPLFFFRFYAYDHAERIHG
jgi:syntaxin-binding protein 1